MDIYVRDGSIIVSGVSCFDLARSCDCGQAFRWKNTGNGWFGVAGGRGATVRQTGETLIITPGKDKDVGFWLNYFDLYRNYQAIEDEVRCDATLGKCLDYASGIHIFNIVDRLCILAGEKHEETTEYYSFPAPEAIAELTVEQLTAIGSGYRAPYIKDSARMIADGYELETLRNMPTAAARKELLRFPGVGPKVADCVLLFSLGHADAFPLDVWMKRAMRLMYFQGAEPGKKAMEDQIAALGPNSGILQQYIFQYARENM